MSLEYIGLDEIVTRRRKPSVLRPKVRSSAGLNKRLSSTGVSVSSIIRKKASIFITFLVLIWSILYYNRQLALLFISGWSDGSHQRKHIDEYPETLRHLWSKIHFPRSVVDFYSASPRNWQYSVSKGSKYSFSYPLLQEISEIFDVRLAPTLSLGLFRQRLEDTSQIDSSYRAPFSWNVWLDLDNRLTLMKYYDDTPVNLSTCEKFKDYYNIDFDIPCVNVNKFHRASSPNTTFVITGPVPQSLPVSARRLIAASYLSAASPIPERLMFLDINDNYDTLVMPTTTCQNTLHCLFDMALNFINRESKYCLSNYCDTVVYSGLTLTDEIQKLAASAEKVIAKTVLVNGNQDSTRLVNKQLRSQRRDDLLLEKDMFIFDQQKLKSKAMARMDSLMTLGSSEKELDFDYKLLKQLANLNDINPSKYFFEAVLTSKNHNGAHYDWRFFNRAIYDDHERNLILHRITKAWLTFTERANITSWLAHGTLLGYYFNGMNMPFDGDLDVTVTMNSLITLATRYNQTLVMDSSTKHNSNESLGIGAYLVDVNPTYFSRTKGNGQNTIDARFICTYSGLYIDITAVTSTIDHAFNKKSLRVFQNEFNMMLDPSYLDQIDIRTLDSKTYNTNLSQTLTDLISNKEIYNCKNNHFYRLNEISPLKEVYFEGLRAKVPNKLENLLNREYHKALHKFRFKNYIFRKQLRLWISIDDCATKLDDLECLKNPKINREFQTTKDFTHTHEYKYKRKNFVPPIPPSTVAPILKDDPWIQQLAEEIYKKF